MEVGNLWVRLGLDKSRFESDINRTRGMVSNFGSFLRNTLGMSLAFAGGQAIFSGLQEGFRNTIKAGFDFNVMMEQNRVAFETMLGSGEKAGAMLQQLSDFAAKTPFEFPDLVNAAKKMMAFGFSAEDVLPTLTAVGDAAAALGLSGQEGIGRILTALGQMRAKGKVSAEEMLQLTEAGVPAWELLAKAMGKSTAEVMKLSQKGLIPADKAIKALVSGMESRFPNMMAKQSQTFAGLMSTLKDNIQITFGTVMEGAFNRLKGSIETAIGITQKFRDIVVAFRTGDNISFFTRLGNAIRVAFGSEAASKFNSIIKEMRPTIDRISGAFDNIRTKISGLKDEIKKQFANLGKVGVDLVFDIKNNNWKKLGENLGNGLKQAIAGLGKYAKDILQAIGQLFASINWGEAGKKAAAAAVPFIVGFINTLLDPGFWLQHWQEALSLLVLVIPIGKIIKIPGLSQFSEWVLSKIGGVLSGFKTRLGPVLSTLWNVFKEGIAKGMGGKINPVWLTKGLITSIKDAIKSAGESAYIRAMYIVENIGKGIGKGIGKVKGKLVEIAQTIEGQIALVVNKAFTWGANLLGEFIRGIKSKISALPDALKGAAQKIKDFLGFHSPTKEGPGKDAHVWGPNMIKTLIEGVRKTTPKLGEQAKKSAAVLRKHLTGSKPVNIDAKLDAQEKAARRAEILREIKLDTLRAAGAKESTITKTEMDANKGLITLFQNQLKELQKLSKTAKGENLQKIQEQILETQQRISALQAENTSLMQTYQRQKEEEKKQNEINKLAQKGLEALKTGNITLAEKIKEQIEAIKNAPTTLEEKFALLYNAAQEQIEAEKQQAELEKQQLEQQKTAAKISILENIARKGIEALKAGQYALAQVYKNAIEYIREAPSNMVELFDKMFEVPETKYYELAPGFNLVTTDDVANSIQTKEQIFNITMQIDKVSTEADIQELANQLIDILTRKLRTV